MRNDYQTERSITTRRMRSYERKPDFFTNHLWLPAGFCIVACLLFCVAAAGGI